MTRPTTFPDAPYVQDDRLIDNDLLPWQHFIPSWNLLDVYTGQGTGLQAIFNVTWTRSVLSWGTANPNELGWIIPVAAGTWTALWYVGKRQDYGIAQMRVDGANVGGTYDGYVAGGANQYGSHEVTGIVLTRGEHTFTLRTAAKNAASTGYLTTICGLALTRTA